MTDIVLVPIEEGRDSAWAVRHVTALHRRGNVRIHLVNVRTPLPSYVARFIGRPQRQEFYQEGGRKAMQEAVRQLDAAGIAHKDHVLIGSRAETIAKLARELHCTHIVVSNPARSLVPDLGLGSIASQLRHLIGASGCEISELR